MKTNQKTNLTRPIVVTLNGLLVVAIAALLVSQRPDSASSRREFAESASNESVSEVSSATDGSPPSKP